MIFLALKLFVVFLKFECNQLLVFLFAKSGNPILPFPPSPQNPVPRVQSYSAVEALSPSFLHNGPFCDRDPVPGQGNYLLGIAVGQPSVPTASQVWKCCTEQAFLCRCQVCDWERCIIGILFIHSFVHQFMQSFIHLTNVIKPWLCVRHTMKALLKDMKTVLTVTYSKKYILHCNPECIYLFIPVTLKLSLKNNTFTYDRGHTLIFAILFFPFCFFHSTKN